MATNTLLLLLGSGPREGSVGQPPLGAYYTAGKRLCWNIAFSLVGKMFSGAEFYLTTLENAVSFRVFMGQEEEDGTGLSPITGR